MASSTLPRDQLALLPPEIRLQIYALLFICHGPRGDISILEPLFHRGKWLKEGSHNLAIPLLRVCKSISAEARPILYAKNWFQIHKSDNAVGFAKNIGPMNASFIRNLTLNTCFFSLRLELPYSVDMVSHFIGLRRLSFIPIEVTDRVPMVNLVFFLRAVQGWLRRHPILRLAASECFEDHKLAEVYWDPGLLRQQLLRRRLALELSLTLTASELEMYPVDGPLLDVDKAIGELEKFTEPSRYLDILFSGTYTPSGLAGRISDRLSPRESRRIRASHISDRLLPRESRSIRASHITSMRRMRRMRGRLGSRY